MIKSLCSLKVFLIFAGILGSCNTANAPFSVIELKNGWEFRRTDTDTAWYPATVPGTVHQDLLALELIPDPFKGLNDEKVQWIENSDWEYRTTFNLDDNILKKENIDFIFNGLDTYASVFLNGELILEADNMFRSWEVPIKKFAVAGENSLNIHFKSPVIVGMKKLKANGYSVPANGELVTQIDQRTSPFTRKAPFHYAWDWAPRLVTSGIWKPVLVRAWDSAKIEQFYFKQKDISSTSAEYQLQLDIIANDVNSLKAVVSADNKILISEQVQVKKGASTVSLDFILKNPKLWWPNGLGEHYLYSIKVQLLDGNKIVDEKNHNLGVRTVQLIQEKDDVGESFYFKVNGVPVFMKGSDYIPKDQLIPRVSDEEYKKLIQTAVEANMNMFRICGCTIYEKDIFYDLCDKYGLLVWQDFMFACNMSPSQPEHLENIQKEVVENIIRLRNHPSLALWCGNNENYVGWNYWHWKDRYGFSDADSLEMWNTYQKIFYGILPDAVAAYDADRSYWPSSPKYSFKNPQNRLSGDQHDWGVWFEQMPIESYAETFGRFVSEYGLQAYPPLETIKTFASDEDLDMNSPVMRHRQRCREEWEELPGADGNDIILRYIKRYYKDPKDFPSLVYLSQLMQAETYKSALTSHRRNMPRCMGSLYWQFNDCWPTISWASLDYYMNWKASLYKVRDANKPILLSFAKNGNDDADLYIVSDKLEVIGGLLDLRLLDFDGKEIWKKVHDIDIKANTSEVLLKNIRKSLPDFDPQKTNIIARLYDENELVTEDIFYFSKIRDLKLPEPKITKEITRTENGYKIVITSNKLAKNVCLSLSGKHGHFSDNFFDLLQGEKKKLLLETSEAEINTDDIKIVSVVDTYSK